MTRHIMIDLETLGTKPGSVIASIGAIEFFPEAGVTGEELHVAVNTTSALLAGLTTDAGTVKWWQNQNPQAQDSITNNPATLGTALSLLTTMLQDRETFSLDAELKIWCRGTSFDQPMLDAAYAALKQPAPWKYWQWRDMRTLLKVCEEHMGYRERVRADVKHDALDDARHQAHVVMDCLRLLMQHPQPQKPQLKVA